MHSYDTFFVIFEKWSVFCNGQWENTLVSLFLKFFEEERFHGWKLALFFSLWFNLSFVEIFSLIRQILSLSKVFLNWVDLSKSLKLGVSQKIFHKLKILDAHQAVWGLSTLCLELNLFLELVKVSFDLWVKLGLKSWWVSLSGFSKKVIIPILSNLF